MISFYEQESETVSLPHNRRLLWTGEIFREVVQESLESANRIPVSHSPGIIELPAQHLKSSVYTVAPLLVLVLLIVALNFGTVLPSCQ